MYLTDRSVDREQRLLVREHEGGPNKGHAGEAIADYLYDMWTRTTDTQGEARRRQTAVR